MKMDRHREYYRSHISQSLGAVEIRARLFHRPPILPEKARNP
jgi:hypothetical protein